MLLVNLVVLSSKCEAIANGKFDDEINKIKDPNTSNKEYAVRTFVSYIISDKL
jgi:hypothetical protein